MNYFDKFIIRQYQGGYTLTVDISRPNNAPSDHYTKADYERSVKASTENVRLAPILFRTLDEVVAEIKRLRYPEEPTNG